MATARVYVRIECGGEILDKRWTREGGRAPSYKWEIPAATAGTLTTRSGETEGVITVASHSLSASDVHDLYFTKENGQPGVRYGIDILSTTGTTLTFEGGHGDVLPPDESPIVVCKARLANLDLRHVLLSAKMFAICPSYLNTGTARAMIVRQYSLGGSERKVPWIANANEIKFLDFNNNREVNWENDTLESIVNNYQTGGSNEGSVVATRYSHSDTTQACTLTLVGIEATT